MTRYEKVQEILEQAVNGRTIHAHGNFWRGATRDQFVAKMIPTFVDPVPLLLIGDGANSNIVKALKGEPPFGDEADSIAPRMPAGFNNMDAEKIAFIETWINDGCPEDEFPAPPDLKVAAPAAAVTPETHVAYWRDFDNWSLLNRDPDVNEAIETRFQPVAGRYLTWVRQQTAAAEQQWSDAVDNMVPALELLATRQRETAFTWYGNPVNQAAFFDSYEGFGAATLPADPQRPGDPHTMNGRFQWFIWAGFADACLRKSILKEFWDLGQRAILIGLLNDGLFRGRFPVVGFTADEAGRADVRAHASGLAGPNLPEELRRRYRQANGQIA